jgi:hypothetical protein
VLLLNKGQSHFRLSFIPKQAGNFSYAISIKDGAREDVETIPVYVEGSRTLNILFLLHYPTFEIQYLKSFLAKKKHGVVLRYQISRNNFRSEFLNHDPLQLNRLTSDMMANFDLVITDGDALKELSQTEKATLKKSIQSGLGLLNLSPTFPNNGRDIYLPVKVLPVKTDTAILRVGTNVVRTAASRLRLAPDPSVTAVLQNKSGILAGYTFAGAGKISFQFLHETYRLTLSGDSLAYGELWSPLIEEIAKPRIEKSKINLITPFPYYQDEPIDVQVISSHDSPALFDDNIGIPLIEDVRIDGVWHGRTWASSDGWHLLETADGVSLPYFVSKSNNLRTLSITDQLEQNKMKRRAFIEESGKVVVWKEVPPAFFFLLFLISAGLLWLAPKL